jgi:hypothetical protein
MAPGPGPGPELSVPEPSRVLKNRANGTVKRALNFQSSPRCRPGPLLHRPLPGPATVPVSL